MPMTAGRSSGEAGRRVSRDLVVKINRKSPVHSQPFQSFGQLTEGAKRQILSTRRGADRRWLHVRRSSRKLAIARRPASVYTAARFSGGPPARATWRWALSSAVEHYLDMVGVRGSIPLAPTIFSKTYEKMVGQPQRSSHQIVATKTGARPERIRRSSRHGQGAQPNTVGGGH